MLRRPNTNQKCVNATTISTHGGAKNYAKL